MSIRSKILLLTISLGIVVIIGFAISNLIMQKQIEEMEKQECILGMDKMKSFMESQLESSESNIASVTLWTEYYEAMIDSDIPWITENVVSYNEEGTNMEYVAAINQEGQVICEENAPDEIKNINSLENKVFKNLSSKKHFYTDIIETNNGLYIYTIVKLVKTEDLEYKEPLGYTIYGRKLNGDLLSKGESITGFRSMIISENKKSIKSKDFNTKITNNIKNNSVDILKGNNGKTITFVEELRNKNNDLLGNIYIQNFSINGTTAINGFIKGIVVISFIIVLLMVGVVMIINYVVIKPIKDVSYTMRDIAKGEGNLNVKIEVKTDDEIGEMANHFNSFIEKLKYSINNIYKDIGILKMTAQKLVDISNLQAKSSKKSSEKAAKASVLADGIFKGFQEMNTNIDSTDKFISKVAISAENMNSTINYLTDSMKNTYLEVQNSSQLVGDIKDRIELSADSAKNVSKSVNNVVDSVKEINISLNEVNRSCNKSMMITQNAKVKADETNLVIELLNNSSKKISNVIKVINDIAEQTNMLALNAAIEAAGAGNAGKGFTVVANEVKELAKQTRVATEEISIQIGDMEEQMMKAVNAVGTISNVVEEIDQITNTITAAVAEQSAAIAGISDSAISAADKVVSITEEIENVSKKAKDVAKSSEQSANAVNTIVKSTQELSDNSNELYEGSDNASKKVRENNAMGNILSNEAKEISEVMESIDNSTKEVSVGTDSTSVAAKELVELAENLEKSISFLKL